MNQLQLIIEQQLGVLETYVSEHGQQTGSISWQMAESAGRIVKESVSRLASELEIKEAELEYLLAEDSVPDNNGLEPDAATPPCIAVVCPQMILPMNRGAELANEMMHRRRVERQNDSIAEKLDTIIELQERLLALLTPAAPDQAKLAPVCETCTLGELCR